MCKFVTKWLKWAKIGQNLLFSVCVRWLAKSMPLPVVAVVTNISYFYKFVISSQTSLSPGEPSLAEQHLIFSPSS